MLRKTVFWAHLVIRQKLGENQSLITDITEMISRMDARGSYFILILSWQSIINLQMLKKQPASLYRHTVYRVNQSKITQHKNHDICVAQGYLCIKLSSFI